MGAQRAMALAQQLYEGVSIPGEGAAGLITYMRTDSLSISPVARREARRYAADRWGEEYVPEKERVYRSRARGAQEAHEAIRPTSAFRTPERLRSVLNRDQLRAYTLIWQRFMASQLADARYATVAVEIAAREGGEPRAAFRANAQRLVFSGHLAALGIDATEESAARAPKRRRPGDGRRPARAGGWRRARTALRRWRAALHRAAAALHRGVAREGRWRTRASGRPSTYASIVQTVLKPRLRRPRGPRARAPGAGLRGQRPARRAHGPLRGRAPSPANSRASSTRSRRANATTGRWVKGFWEPFNSALETAKQEARKQVEETDIVCSKCGERKMVVRWSRNGKFLGLLRLPPSARTPCPSRRRGRAAAGPGAPGDRLEVPPAAAPARR